MISENHTSGNSTVKTQAFRKSDEIDIGNLNGAGIICFSQIPQTKEYAIILGRERMTPGWRQGSHKWSSFSGRLDNSEDAFSGASREFVEESMGIIPLDDTMDKPVSCKCVQTHLLKASYEGIVTHTCESKEIPLRKHLSFVCRIPYSPLIPSEFRTLRERLLVLDDIFKRYHRIRKTLCEVPRLFVPGFRLSPFVVVTDVRVAATYIEVDTGSETCAESTTTEYMCGESIKLETSRIAKAWNDVKAAVEEAAAHPALVTKRAGDVLIGAYVERSYMEKSEVKWWTIGELEKISRSKQTDNFRRCFTDVLPSLIELIKSLKKVDISDHEELNTLL